eukprot:9216870-Alexandrium_andersonii.AAC.1
MKLEWRRADSGASWLELYCASIDSGLRCQWSMTAHREPTVREELMGFKKAVMRVVGSTISEAQRNVFSPGPRANARLRCLGITSTTPHVGFVPVWERSVWEGVLGRLLLLRSSSRTSALS